MTTNSIPQPAQPIAGGLRVDATWYRWLRELDRLAAAQGVDASEAIAAIARKLGSPDGSIDGIPDGGEASVRGLFPIAVLDGLVTLTPAQSELIGALQGFTVDQWGRIVGARPVVAGAGITIDGTTNPAQVELRATGMTNPMTAAEDMVKGGSGGSPARLPVGSNGQVLTVSGGVVGWSTPPTNSVVTSTVTPAALAVTPAIGTSPEASRADHVHVLPTATQVGAAPTVHGHTIPDVAGLQPALDAKLDDSQASAAGLAVLGAADGAAQRAAMGAEPAFAKGSLVVGSGVTLSGTLTDRLVGAGNVIISAIGGGYGIINRITTTGDFRRTTQNDLRITA